MRSTIRSGLRTGVVPKTCVDASELEGEKPDKPPLLGAALLPCAVTPLRAESLS